MDLNPVAENASGNFGRAGACLGAGVDVEGPASVGWREYADRTEPNALNESCREFWGRSAFEDKDGVDVDIDAGVRVRVELSGVGTEADIAGGVWGDPEDDTTGSSSNVSIGPKTSTPTA